VGAALALLLPGSLMEAAWLLYPERRAILIPHHLWLVPASLSLAAANGCGQHQVLQAVQMGPVAGNKPSSL